MELIPWARLGRTEPAFALLHDAVQGGLWLGFLDGGVAYFKDGQLRASYASAEGLGQGMVRDFYIDGNGTLWTATDGGLSRIEDGRVLTLTSQNGLPCDTVHWMREDDSHSVWLYLACGLLRIGRSELDSWASHPKQTIHATVFDSADGVSSHRFTSGYNSVVAKSADGKLWFVRDAGVSVIDPHHLAFNELPPPVHIEHVTADDKIYDATNGLRLPPRIRNLAIDYTALSFVAPEKVRFRYKLEGQNRNWHEVINDRQVQYTNLAPGTYRFRVMASNNSGVWNEAGDTLELFDCSRLLPDAVVRRDGGARRSPRCCGRRINCGSGRSRGSSIGRWTRGSASGRASRATCTTRCCRASRALLLRFQSARTCSPTRPDEARQRLERALDQAEAAITEGRNAVQGLRASATTVNDLANGIAAIGVQLTSEAVVRSVPPIDVDGRRRVARPESRRPRGSVPHRRRGVAQRGQARPGAAHHRDDPLRAAAASSGDSRRGKGIDAETMARQQAAGHFGLPGMRERAAIVKGRLDVRSEPALAPRSSCECRRRSPTAGRPDRGGRESFPVSDRVHCGPLRQRCPRSRDQPASGRCHPRSRRHLDRGGRFPDRGVGPSRLACPTATDSGAGASSRGHRGALPGLGIRGAPSQCADKRGPPCSPPQNRSRVTRDR